MWPGNYRSLHEVVCHTRCSFQVLVQKCSVSQAKAQGEVPKALHQQQLPADISNGQVDLKQTDFEISLIRRGAHDSHELWMSVVRIIPDPSEEELHCGCYYGKAVWVD